MKKLIYVICSLMAIFGVLGAVDLYVTNDVADMVATKKICVRINFDKSEQALYKDTLCFSVDAPDLELKSWRTSAQESLQYIPLLKRGKKLYMQSFNLELVIDFDMQNKLEQATLLNKTTLYVSALALEKQGGNKVVNLMAPLSGSIVNDTSFTTTLKSLTTTLSTTLTSSFLGRLLNNQIFTTKLIVNSELLFVDRLKALWVQIRTLVAGWITSPRFFHWYLGLIFMFIFLIIMQRSRLFAGVRVVHAWWFWELEVILISLVCIGFLIMCRSVIPRYLLYKIFGFMSIPLALYFLWAGNETFWGRLKGLVGLIFATAVLPLLVKGYLLQYLDVLTR